MRLQKTVLRYAAAALVVVGMLAGCSSKQSSAPASPGGAPTNRAAPPPVTAGEPPATGCTVPAGTASTMSARPTGLVAFDIYEKGKVPFAKRVFHDALVSGVDVDIQWDNLEPAPNTFDWSALDCVFAQADANHKFVVLAVIPGFRSPSWVLQLPGVQTQSFKFAYFNQRDRTPGVAAALERGISARMVHVLGRARPALRQQPGIPLDRGGRSDVGVDRNVIA